MCSCNGINYSNIIIFIMHIIINCVITICNYYT
ncbi:hypothetical protein vBEcoMWL3_gp082 [Escherichia phage vB_EcoM_WL-3]|nr:hypothetical protein vBEcoMWL3_gp082 [Escherichia phage vB_EcoM_WL-3]